MNTASRPSTTDPASASARETVKALYAHVRPHRWVVALGLLCALVGAAGGLLQPLATKALVDRLGTGGAITGLLALLVALALAGAAIAMVSDYLLERAAESVVLVARKRLTGKFYYRPPGGESWADVALRLRSALSDIQRDHPDGRVLVVAHDAVVVLTRYVVERLTEQEVLEIERTLVPNASLTLWARKDGELRLVASNSTDHLDAADLPA